MRREDLASAVCQAIETYLAIGRPIRSEDVRSAAPFVRGAYRTAQAEARGKLLALLRAMRDLTPGALEVRTAGDLAALAIDPSVPIETITELLYKLEARDDDAEPVAIFGADDVSEGPTDL